MISFIIPCKNEESGIQICIDSVLTNIQNNNCEIIVIDNGSTDSSYDILKEYGNQIRLFQLPARIISEVRNYGASYAKGEWLAFIDGDVVIHESWLDAFNSFLKEHNRRQLSKIVTGSTCLIPNHPTWIEKTWFEQLNRRDQQNSNYINSGHLIISKTFFNDIGGFDTNFKTGEDEKLCKDALKLGGIVKKERSLKAIHLGYPKTLKTFFKRELWHGLGLRNNFKTFWKYRDLLLAFYTLTLLLLSVISAFLEISMIIILLAAVTMWIGPLFGFSFIRSNASFKSVFLLTVLFSVYALAKSVAVLDILIFRSAFLTKLK